MEIVESWEDDKSNVYAIARYSTKEQQEYKIKEYEALWMDEKKEKHPELNSFAGTVGYNIASFDTVTEVQEFLLKGISEQEVNPDIWWAMLRV